MPTLVSDDTTEAIREAASAGPLVPLPLHDVHSGAIITTTVPVLCSYITRGIGIPEALSLISSLAQIVMKNGFHPQVSRVMTSEDFSEQA